jgi:thiol-disulfide isomerase/thioredoxin
MKQCLLFILLLGHAFITRAQQNLVIEPLKPQPGSTITIRYNPKNTSLSGVKDFEGYAYLLEGKLPLVQAVPLRKEGGVYVGTVKTNDSTKAVFFSFSNGEVKENNNDEGYYTVMYDKKGSVLEGSNLALARGADFAGFWGLRFNEKAKEIRDKEFASPVSREKFLKDYLVFLGQSKEASDKDLLSQELKKYVTKTDLSEQDLMDAKWYYERYLKDKEQGEAVYALVKQRFPNGNWKRTEQMAAFQKEKSLAEKAKLFDQFIATYQPFSKEEQPMVDQMAGTLTQRFADSAAYTEMQKYAGMIKSNSTLASVYNSIAWKMAGEGVNNPPRNVALGKELSQKSLQLMDQEINKPSNKPFYITDKQWVKNLQSTYYMYADTYATLLYHNKEYDEAYALEKKAMENFQRKNVDMNEAFSLLTEKIKGPKEAQAELEKFFEEGKYSPKMKEQLKAIYLAQNKSEDQWLQYAGGLEQMAFNKLKAELAKQMVNMPAPDFKLKDLTGKEVALSSLKGKVVVVDFWATWCGPCIASFPGMQKAVEKYKNNPDVVFLFIDTWENGDDREKKVKDFVEKNKYPFLILYDETKKDSPDEFVIVSNYKVEGIPTKFVIDKNSNIRFKSVGYNGSADALFTEMTAMIDMAASDSESNGTKKAF